jgi:hypothetical protein
MNPAAQNFEPRTENTRPNFQEQKPPNRNSGDVLKNAFRGRKLFCEEVKSPSSSQYHLIPEEITKRDSSNKTAKL